MGSMELDRTVRNSWKQDIIYLAKVSESVDSDTLLYTGEQGSKLPEKAVSKALESIEMNRLIQ